MIYAAKDLGFGAEAQLRDRNQMQFVAALVRQGASRFILKGGMAMRALYGSTRLTRDVDFDCEESISQQSMGSHMTKALTQSARQAGLVGAKVSQPKKGDRSSRWTVAGATPEGVSVNWDVEVSRRGVPPPEFIETRTFEVPHSYGIPSFIVRVYGAAAMAGGKVNALLSPNRAVPRDVYDLFELMHSGADPVPLWVRCVPRAALESRRADIMAKIDSIDFALANSELLPYVSPDIRRSIDLARWDDIRMQVAEQVDQWFARAGEQAGAVEEPGHDDIDLAGR